MHPLEHVDYNRFKLAPEFYQEKIKWSGRQVNVDTGKERVITWITADNDQVVESKKLKDGDALVGLGVRERPVLLGVNRDIDSGWKDKISAINKYFQQFTSKHVEELQGKSQKEKNYFLGNLINLNWRFIKSLSRKDRLLIKAQKEHPEMIRGLRTLLGMFSQNDKEVVDTAVGLLRNQSLEKNGANWRDVLQVINNSLPIEEKIDLVDVGFINLKMNPLYLDRDVREISALITPHLLEGKVDLSKKAILFDSAFNEFKVVSRAEYKEYIEEFGLSAEEMNSIVLKKLVLFLNDPIALEEELIGKEALTAKEIQNRFNNLFENLRQIVSLQKAKIDIPSRYFRNAFEIVSTHAFKFIYDKAIDQDKIDVDQVLDWEEAFREIFREIFRDADKRQILTH